MPGKSLEQRLADTQTRIRQMEARKQNLVQALRQQDRKERTRRLIQIGGIMAKLGIDTLEKAQAFQRVVEQQPQVREWLGRVTALADGQSHAEEDD